MIHISSSSELLREKTYSKYNIKLFKENIGATLVKKDDKFIFMV